MDQVSSTIGLSALRDLQPKSLTEWNAQYEAMSLEGDWWFKAGVALVGWVRSAANLAANFAAAPALRAAHA
jgi:hypothetical protein